MVRELSYFPYYQRAITTTATGFKLVLGGTGLGKTDAITQCVHAAENADRKFVYCANRKQLLEQLAHKFDQEGASEEYVYIRRDLEAVLLTLRVQRSVFDELLDTSLFRDNVKRANERYPFARIDLPAVRRAAKTLADLDQSMNGRPLPVGVDAQCEEHARTILSAFRYVLLAANDRTGTAPTFNKLADHPVVQELFPCIAFQRRKAARIMLLTLHKAFYGFFDGREMLNLMRLQDDKGGYVIFLDEFDFLENDLVGLICNSTQVSDPFRFVEHFYRAMTRDKLPLETYPLSENIRNRIRQITNEIDALPACGIHFPHINQFTSEQRWHSPQRQHQRSGAEPSPAIFRTNHAVGTTPLYVRETNRAFHLIPQHEEGAYSALDLFTPVSIASDRILGLFKELRRTDEIAYHEMLRQCFEDTIYPAQIELVAQFPRRGHDQQTARGALLDRGYSLFDIEHLRQRTDQDEVKVRHYGMYLTPDAILTALARHNLVFGLSATADIPRCVHNFDLAYLGNLDVQVLDVDAEDRALIGALNAAKAARRGNHITVAVLPTLSGEDMYQRRLNGFLTTLAKADEDFGQDTATGILLQRTQSFFAALLWMCEHARESDSLLLFLNTFKQVQLIFNRYPTPEDGLFVITRRMHESTEEWLHVYELALSDHRFLVVFYDAALARQLRQSEQAQRHYHALFWHKLPVVVVTQYLSAGAGVNLQYRPTPMSTQEQDFTHIGLLETPYFYFSKADSEMTESERLAMLKENIWYQAKLFANNVITETRFKQRLATLHAPDAWNELYQHDPSTAADALFNHMATFIQALGRVERVWTPMPDQVALLAPKVYERFQTFCSPVYEEERARRAPIISNNLHQIFAHIEAELPEVESAALQQLDTRLQAKDARCRHAIQQLVRRLEGFRSGNQDREAREHWEHLREVTLRHDFSHPLLHEYGCVTDSPYYADGILYLTRDRAIAPARFASLPGLNARPLRMDAVYDLISDNRVIKDYFEEHGYKLAFEKSSTQFLVPYCYQAILIGAIGEEAIKALLQAEGIELEAVPDALFELADLKVADKPWYIDCKHYRETTLERFSVSEEDPTWHPELNDDRLRDKARQKLERIAQYHGNAESKLIYLNLVSSQERGCDYYDSTWSGTVPTFAEAGIVVVQGALRRRAPNAHQQGFEHFLDALHRLLDPAEPVEADATCRGEEC